VHPVQNIAARVLSDIIRRQPPSRERTSFAWSVVAGPALARATAVELRGEVLHVTAKDARWAREVERAREGILSRLRSLLGNDLRDLRVLVGSRASDVGPRSSAADSRT
jgi:predicted nucleic acid-binding Zn ribbon protein